MSSLDWQYPQDCKPRTVPGSGDGVFIHSEIDLWWCEFSRRGLARNGEPLEYNWGSSKLLSERTSCILGICKISCLSCHRLLEDEVASTILKTKVLQDHLWLQVLHHWSTEKYWLFIRDWVDGCLSPRGYPETKHMGDPKEQETYLLMSTLEELQHILAVLDTLWKLEEAREWGKLLLKHVKIIAILNDQGRLYTSTSRQCSEATSQPFILWDIQRI